MKSKNAMRPPILSKLSIYTIFTILSFSLLSCTPLQFDDKQQVLPKTVDFNFHIRPILADRCYKCHGPDKNTREANLRLDIQKGAFALLDSAANRYAIVSGNLKKSELSRRISSTDPEVMMPPPESNLSLSSYEIALLQKWIKQGAEWKAHWAFIPPLKANLPSVSDPNWPQNEIDYFILEQLDQKGWQPAPPEDKTKLLRRLSFDTRGLPPSLEEIDAFIADTSPTAYEQLVDRMLASTAYGERMAVEWLDLGTLWRYPWLPP